MRKNIKSNYVWVIGGLVTTFFLLYLYPKSSFKSMDLEITRSEAIDIAENVLSEKGIDFSDYLNTAHVRSNNEEIVYYMQNFSSPEFNSLISKDELPNLSWRIQFFKNLSRNIPQTTYTIEISRSGKIIRFNRYLPDSFSTPSLQKNQAEALIKNYVREHSLINIDNFSLKESSIENYEARVDYNFEWEKPIEGIDAKLILIGSVQGNQPGGFRYFLQLPENGGDGFNSFETLFGTVSLIFIFFLTQFAIFHFLKRYHQGEVWVQLGKNLFYVFYLVELISLINSWPMIARSVNIGATSVLMTKIIIAIGTAFFVYFILAILVFSTWSVGESIARSVWKEKLLGMDAFIKGRFFSRQSANSLVRGLLISLFFSFIMVAISIYINDKNLAILISPALWVNIFGTFSPAVDVISSSFMGAVLSSITVTFFVINISYQKWQNKTLSIVLSSVVFTLASVIVTSPPSLNNFQVNLLLNFVLGIVFALIYFKYDLLTLLSLHFYLFLIGRSLVMSASTDPYHEINFYLVLIVILFAPAAYIYSKFRKEDFILEDFGIPVHIKRISDRERMKKELEIAAKVQLSLLPKEQPNIKGYDIASLSIPAKEAGGDYFDFVKFNSNKMGIAIGDVSGKGIGAAIYMTLTKGILQAHAEENVTPKKVLGKVNKLMYKTIEKNSFVSMIYLILDTKNHSILFSRAGHNPAIHFSAKKNKSEFLKSNGIALGLEAGEVFDSTLNENTADLKSGDILVLYTDGFTEAMDEKLNQFGEEKLLELITENKSKSSSEILNELLKKVEEFTQGFPQHDDMTVVILKREDI